MHCDRHNCFAKVRISFQLTKLFTKKTHRDEKKACHFVVFYQCYATDVLIGYITEVFILVYVNLQVLVLFLQ